MNQEERNASLERVIENYSNMLYKICFLMLKNEQDTKDVLQETFLAYMTKRPHFHSEEHKKAWLIKVSQNKCREFLRFHKMHAGIPLDEVEESIKVTKGLDMEDNSLTNNSHSFYIIIIKKAPGTPHAEGFRYYCFLNAIG